MLNLLGIAIIIVFIIDLSGFVDEISRIIWKGMYPNVKYNGGRIPKPLSCSLCSTGGIGILYLLLTGTFSWFMLLYVAMLSFLTPVIAAVLILIKDSAINLINKIYELFN